MGNAAIAIGKLRVQPYALTVHRTDGEATQIVVADVRRWRSRTIEMLDSLPWEAIEPIDKAGKMIGPRLENADANANAAGELEDLEPEPSAINANLSGLLSLMLRAQDVALRHQSRAYDSVLQNNQKLLSVISDRLAAMERNAHSQLEKISTLHARLNSSGDGDGDGDSELLGAVAQVLMQPKAGA